MSIRSFIKALSDLLFPELCAGCHEEQTTSSSVFCMECAGKLPLTHMTPGETNEFQKHFTGRLHIESGMALYYFTKGGFIQEALHTMKYKNRPQIGAALGRRLGHFLMQFPTYSDCDVVVGVPLHTSKYRKRGFNQADYIAHGVAEVMGIPRLKGIVVRSSKTSSQTRMTRLNRMKNMVGSFSVKDIGRIEGKHVLLVDDVLTTGATLDFCGQAILSCRPAKLSLATVAMGSVV